MKNFKHFLLIGIFALTYCKTIAQERSDTVNLYLINTIDNNEFIGEILNEDSDSLRIKTEILGEITISRSSIQKISPISITQLKGKEYWFENPQATRYFWSPNGYGLKKGEGYYQNVWILFNQFAVGVTDFFSLGGGILPAFLFAGAPTPVWITPKFSIPVSKEKFNLGIGALAGTMIGNEGSNFGILYGTSTFGSRDKNLSIGIGYGFAGGEMAKSPTINISTMIRVGKRGYFLSENYYIPTSDATILISIGGRSIINNVSLDYGLFIPIVAGSDAFVAVPWLGIVIPFGRKD